MLNIIHFPIVTHFKCIVYYGSNNIQLFCVRVYWYSFFTNYIMLILFQILQLKWHWCEFAVSHQKWQCVPVVVSPWWLLPWQPVENIICDIPFPTLANNRGQLAFQNEGLDKVNNAALGLPCITTVYFKWLLATVKWLTRQSEYM